MNTKLFIEALLKFLLGIILIGLILFVSAGTIKYWNGWLFMMLLFIPMLVAGVVMMVKSPELLKSRLNANEKEKEQKLLVKLSGVMFLLGFIVAGLDYRFKICSLPNVIVVDASIIFLLSYILYAEVLRENAFLSRTIEVQQNQKIIDTGIYSIVRHPMYFATLFLFLTMPLVLGSLLSFVIFLLYPFIIVRRIKNEEKVLENNLIGYKEYKKKVKYKLIPFIW